VEERETSIDDGDDEDEEEERKVEY